MNFKKIDYFKEEYKARFEEIHLIPFRNDELIL